MGVAGRWAMVMAPQNRSDGQATVITRGSMQATNGGKIFHVEEYQPHIGVCCPSSDGKTATLDDEDDDDCRRRHLHFCHSLSNLPYAFTFTKTKTIHAMIMAKSKNDVNIINAVGTAVTEAGQKRKRTVEVVVCPTAFPDFSTVGGSTSRRREQQRNNLASNSSRSSNSEHKKDGARNRDMPPALDIQETIREVHKFGAEGFTGAQKKSHQAAELERLTGQTAKRQKIPTKILVGMRKKAMKREERERQELKESGVVNSLTSQGIKKKSKDRRQSKDDQSSGRLRGVLGSNHARNTGDRRRMDPRSFGPAPDVGFMRKGMLKVKQP